MARKSNGESAISLFSFQDIITSITGIMFLVVLLLMLMMITSRVPTGKNSRSSESVKELQKELTELKNKLQELRDSQKNLDKEIDNLKKLSPEEIQKQKEEPAGRRNAKPCRRWQGLCFCKPLQVLSGYL